MWGHYWLEILEIESVKYKNESLSIILRNEDVESLDWHLIFFPLLRVSLNASHTGFWICFRIYGCVSLKMAGNGAGRETWKSGEFLSGMWPLLRIGKFLGMFHLRRISSMEVSYTPGTPFTILSVGIWSTIASIFVMALVIMYRSLDSPKSLAEQCLDLVFHLHVLLTHSYCMFQSQYFPSVFKKWAILEEKLNWIESLRHFECWKERKGPNCRPLKLENQNSASFPLELLKKKLRLPSKLLKQSNYVLTCWVITGVYISLTLIRVLAYFTSVWLREEPPTIWKYLHILSEIYVLKEISNSWTGIYILLAGKIFLSANANPSKFDPMGWWLKENVVFEAF